MLITLGVVGLLDSFVRFAVQGVGTPAPVFPTRRLVVSGLYRFVRNPMYIAVVSTILGQGLVLGNVTLLEYSGLVWLLFHLFVLVYEEPTLGASLALSTVCRITLMRDIRRKDTAMGTQHIFSAHSVCVLDHLLGAEIVAASLFGTVGMIQDRTLPEETCMFEARSAQSSYTTAAA